MTNSLNLHALALKDATTLTLSSGVVTAVQQYHIIAAESGTSDTVDTISLGYTNLSVKGNTYRPYLLVYADAGDTITFAHNTGNLQLTNDTDITITGNAGLWLFWRGSAWYGMQATVNASNVAVEAISGATYTNLQNVIDLVLSAGWISGGALTDNADGTVDIATGTGFIRSSDSATAPLYLFDWAETTGIDVSSGDGTYIYLDYNGGAPVVSTTTTGADIRGNEHDKFELYEVIWDGTALHVTDHRQIAGDAVNLMQQRMYDIFRIQRADAYGGLIITEIGTRNIAMTAGRIWIKLVASDIGAVDTSAADTFDRFYSDGGSGWTKQAAQTQWDNTHYDDGSGVLATLAPARYSNQYFYIEADGNMACLFGQAQYTTQAAAEAETPPTSMPELLEDHALLIGRVLFQKSDSAAIAVQSAFTNVFALSGSTGSLPSDPLSLDHGGTGSDLSATGPGALYQASAGANVSIVSIIPYNYKQGFRIKKIGASSVAVQPGAAGVATILVNKKTTTILDPSVNGDWLAGTSLELNSAFHHVYVNTSGSVKFGSQPLYPVPDTASRICAARVNQAGWVGTAGNGLNATSMVYDDGAGGNPTGEGNITAGMLVGIFTDSAYVNGRGKGSAAAGGAASMSYALITAVNTGTNTLTLEAGHQIAIQDNDYLMVIQGGPPLYFYYSSAWWRWLGAIYNDSSGNLAEKYNHYAQYTADEVSNYSTASTTFTAVDSTNLSLQVIVTDKPVTVNFIGAGVGTAWGSTPMKLNINLDGAAAYADDGLTQNQMVNSVGAQVSLNTSFITLTPGTHTFVLMWATASGTVTLYAGAGTSTHDIHPQFSVREV
jgi:hypothetical protein